MADMQINSNRRSSVVSKYFDTTIVGGKRIAIWFGIFASCFFVVGTSRSIIVFVTRFWYGTSKWLQISWEKVLECTGEDPVTLWVYGPMVIMLVFYWAGGLVFILMDLTNKPNVLRRYKIRPGTNEPVEPRKLLKAILWTVCNQTVVAYPVGRLCLWVMEYRGYPSFRQLPSLQTVIIDMFILALISEAVFYYSHRLLHIQPFYTYIHKQHHEWKSPVAIAAFYCHPIEHVIGNLSSLNIGYMVMGSHVITVYLYYIIGVVDALNNHCGYHFPFFKSPEFHDFHHGRFTECFGLLGLLDWLHGTDKKFRESVECKRHSVMLHLVPPRQLIAN